MKMKQKVHLWLFWSAFVLYLASTTLQFTMVTELGWVSRVLALARYLSSALAGVKILWDFALLCQGEGGRWALTSQALGCAIKYVLMGGVVLLVVWTSGDTMPLFVLALLLASKGVELNRIFTTALPIQVGLFVLVLLLATAGIIQDLLFFRDAQTVRHGLGFTYPTVVMTYFFFALVAAFWGREKGISIQTGGWLLAVNYLLFCLTDARNGFLLSTVMIVVEVVLGYRTHWERWANGMRQKTWVKGVCRVVRHVYDYCAVYRSALLAVLCVTYPGGLGGLVNNLLSNRVGLTVKAASNYGIHWLGNSIQWIGYGGLTEWESIEKSYNFVDCSYALTLFNYGVILSALVLVLLVLLGKRLRRAGNWNHCFLYASVLICSFIEPRLLEIHLNLILFAAAPMLYSTPKLLGGKR